jgi:hypothetical protein
MVYFVLPRQQKKLISEQLLVVIPTCLLFVLILLELLLQPPYSALNLILRRLILPGHLCYLEETFAFLRGSCHTAVGFFLLNGDDVHKSEESLNVGVFSLSKSEAKSLALFHQLSVFHGQPSIALLILRFSKNVFDLTTSFRYRQPRLGYLSAPFLLSLRLGFLLGFLCDHWLLLF